MESSTAIDADLKIRQLRDNMHEDRVLDAVIDLVTTVSDFLCGVRSVGQA